MINSDIHDMTKKKKTIAFVAHSFFLKMITGTEWNKNDRTQVPSKFHDFKNCEFYDCTYLFDNLYTDYDEEQNGTTETFEDWKDMMKEKEK